jgi:hypothetical protein
VPGRSQKVSHIERPRPSAVRVPELLGAHVHEVRRRGKPGGALSPCGQSSMCTARSTGLTLLACSAAQSNAVLLDAESSSPTTISFLIPHLHSVGRHHLHLRHWWPGRTRTTALGRPWRGLAALAADTVLYAYVLLAGEQQSGLRTDVCVNLGSSMLPNHPVG